MVKAKAKAASSDAKTPKKAQAKAPSSAQPDANNRPTRPHKKRPHKKGPHKKGPKEPRKKGPKHLQKKRQARRKVPCPSKDGIVPLRIKTESLPGQKLKQANPEKFSLFSWARVDWHTGEFVYFTKPPPYWAWYLATASALLKKYLKSCDQKQQHELPTALGARKVQLMESHKAGQRHRKSPQGAGKPPGGKEEAGLEDDDADDEDNMQFYNYTDELSRLSYFFYLVPRHTVTIADALKGVTAHIEPVISAKRNARKPVVVTSIGGGQLPDVFGFLVYASQTSHYTPEQRIVFHVYDTAVWKQTCEHGQALVQQFFPNCELHYHVFDATGVCGCVCVCVCVCARVRVLCVCVCVCACVFVWILTLSSPGQGIVASRSHDCNCMGAVALHGTTWMCARAPCGMARLRPCIIPWA